MMSFLRAVIIRNQDREFKKNKNGWNESKKCMYSDWGMAINS